MGPRRFKLGGERESEVRPFGYCYCKTTKSVPPLQRSSDLLGPRASRPHRVAIRSRSEVLFKLDSLAFNESGRDARGPSKSLDRWRGGTDLTPLPFMKFGESVRFEKDPVATAPGSDFV
jgi:hypothetical protein